MRARIRISESKIINIMFDLSLLLYFIAFFTFPESDKDAMFRNVATLSTFFFGAVITLQRKKLADGFICGYVIFVLFGLFSALWATEAGNVLMLVNSFIRIIALFVFINNRIKNINDVERIFALLIIAIVYHELYVMKMMVDYYSFAGLFTHRFGDNFEYNSNMNSMMAVIGFYLLFYFLAVKKKKLIPIIGMAFCTFIVIVCGSRKGILALFLVGLIMALIFSNGMGKIYKLLFGAVAMIVAVIACLNVPILYDAIGRRLEELLELAFGLLNGNYASDDNRVELIKQAFDLWLDNPIIGCGLNNFSVYQTIGGEGYYAHNNFLELLADVGIIGFLLYYANICKTVFVRTPKKDFVAVMLKSVCIVLLIMDVGMVTYNSWSYLIVYYLLYICSRKAIITERSSVHLKNIYER